MEENQTCQRQDMLFTPTALTNYRILHIAYAALCALTILTNTLVLFAFYKLSYYRTNHYKFLITLSITDLLSGLIPLPIIVYDFSLLAQQVNDCDLSTATRLIGYELIFISVTTIVLINGEQYIKIVRPYFQCDWKPWKIFLALFTIWTIFLIIVILSLYVYEDVMFKGFKFACSVAIIVVFIIMCFTQIQINRQVNLMATREVSNGSTRKKPKEKSEASKMTLRTSRMAKSILIAFGVCFSPVILVSVTQMLYPDYTIFISTYLRSWSYYITYLNPFLDPLIYCIRMKSIRSFLLSHFKSGDIKTDTTVTEVISDTPISVKKESDRFSFVNNAHVAEDVEEVENQQ